MWCLLLLLWMLTPAPFRALALNSRQLLVETAKIVAAGCSPYSISFEKAFTISLTQAPIPISAIGIVHPV